MDNEIAKKFGGYIEEYNQMIIAANNQTKTEELRDPILHEFLGNLVTNSYLWDSIHQERLTLTEKIRSLLAQNNDNDENNSNANEHDEPVSNGTGNEEGNEEDQLTENTSDDVDDEENQGIGNEMDIATTNKTNHENSRDSNILTNEQQIEPHLSHINAEQKTSNEDIGTTNETCDTSDGSNAADTNEESHNLPEASHIPANEQQVEQHHGHDHIDVEQKTANEDNSSEVPIDTNDPNPPEETSEDPTVVTASDVHFVTASEELWSMYGQIDSIQPNDELIQEPQQNDNVFNGEVPTSDVTSNQNAVLPFAGAHERELVLLAVTQMENDYESDELDENNVQTPDSTTTPEFLMDIGSEVNVITTPSAKDSLEELEIKETTAGGRPKRARKTKPELLNFLKRKRSMSIGTNTSDDAHHKKSRQPPARSERPANYVSEDEDARKLSKAMKKRHSATRKTVSSSHRPTIEDDEESNLNAERIRFIKRPRTMNAVRSEDKGNESMDEDVPQRTKNEKMAKAKKIRRSSTRKTVSYARQANEEDEEAAAQPDEQQHTMATKKPKPRRNTVSNARPTSDNMASAVGRNTNQQMYAKNHLYNTLCVLCDKTPRPGYLASHYINYHPEHEVMIARMSPKMAAKLRAQSYQFKRVAGKIKGLCFFCEEDKEMSKCGWEMHLLTHTGESMIHCAVCQKRMKSKNQHGQECSGEAVRIYHENVENATDCSVLGFMCNECNYVQIGRDRMVKHLETEHGYLGPSEKNHYKKLNLLKY